MVEFLNENHILLTELEINLLFNRFDKDKDNKISYNEFEIEIRPKIAF